MLRALVSLLIRFALRTYYRRIDVLGRERIPRAGPLLLVANHYNSLVDPLVLQAALGRWVTFAAAEFLFHGPLGAVMKALGMIPIYRASDELDPAQNLASFRRCFEVLRAGGAVAIFPEGKSHSEPHVLRLKSGAARIFFGAHRDWTERHPGAGPMPLTLLPIGLLYEAKERFQGQVTVVVGEPLDSARWLALESEHPQRAVRQLTAELQRLLEQLTFSQETWEDYRFVNQTTQFYLGARTEVLPGAEAEISPERELAIRTALREGFFELRQRDPQALDALRHQVTAYSYLLWRLGITDRHVRENHRLGRAARFIAKNLELLVLGWPPALWGIVNSWPAYRVTGFLANRVLHGPRDVRSTHKIYWGVPIFLLFGLLQTALVTWLCVGLGGPWWAGLIYLVSLPVAGWYAVAFLDRRRLALQSVRAWAVLLGHRRLRESLRRRRARLVETLARLIETHRPEALPGPPSPLPTPAGEAGPQRAQ